jgi:molybdenum cofactor cytidylyltransferase
MNNRPNLNQDFACIILAAGQSSRMGRSKIILPWGGTTVIGKIIASYLESGIGEIIVVTGGYRELVEAEVAKFHVKSIFNPDFANGEMGHSLREGLGQLTDSFKGIFIALGDQPDIDPIDLHGMMEKSNDYPESVIIPSYSMRRGHPWLVPQKYLAELQALRSPDTMKTFIQKHEADIQYYVVQKSNILADLDTPEDYEKLKPK